MSSPIKPAAALKQEKSKWTPAEESTLIDLVLSKEERLFGPLKGAASESVRKFRLSIWQKISDELNRLYNMSSQPSGLEQPPQRQGYMLDLYNHGNQCNPNHSEHKIYMSSQPSGLEQPPQRQGYMPDLYNHGNQCIGYDHHFQGSQQDASNHANQLNPNNPAWSQRK